LTAISRAGKCPGCVRLALVDRCLCLSVRPSVCPIQSRHTTLVIRLGGRSRIAAGRFQCFRPTRHVTELNNSPHPGPPPAWGDAVWGGTDGVIRRGATRRRVAVGRGRLIVRIARADHPLFSGRPDPPHGLVRSTIHAPGQRGPVGRAFQFAIRIDTTRFFMRIDSKRFVL